MAKTASIYICTCELLDFENMLKKQEYASVFFAFTAKDILKCKLFLFCQIRLYICIQIFYLCISLFVGEAISYLYFLSSLRIFFWKFILLSCFKDSL